MVHYVDVGKYAGLTPHDLAPSMASALFMDHYVPGTVAIGSAWSVYWEWHNMCSLVATLYVIAVCRFSARPQLDIMGPTMSPSILAIDGGGVRGVIPLEFLLLVQEHLNPCTIQDVIDLGIGTSSGGLIIQGLFIMSWTVPECSRTFESLAHRIFSQRRNSAALNLIRPFITGRSLVSESARWLSWLLRDSCYDARVFDDVLKETFGEYRRMFGPSRDDPREQSYSSTKAGVVATGISRDTSTFVFANFNPTSRNEAVKVIESSGLVTPHGTPRFGKRPGPRPRPPFFFTPADLQGIGSFQDGGLKHNFAGAIALEVSHQIWPNAGGFLRRGFDAWMSTMDTEQDWRKYKSRLSRQGAFDTIRLNVPLGDTPNGIDAVARIEEYRGLVIAQPGSARMAREAATMLLVSRFYFIICGLPEDTTAPFWCCGMIRCKGPAQSIIEALEHLYPDGTRWMSDYGLLENFQGQSGICPSCGGYSQEIRILARHEDHEINIFLETGSKKRWRASGFPATVASFVDKQGFHSRFGRDDHGKPGWASCKMCDVSRMQTKRKCAIVAPNAETPKRARRPERK
ncbi:Patatin-like serine hydrolase [Penicillium chermesinum]|nr:Patatin-like serine hydrolase [Penicillium chermesinum]